jgi:hypothetical protein
MFKDWLDFHDRSELFAAVVLSAGIFIVWGGIGALLVSLAF